MRVPEVNLAALDSITKRAAGQEVCRHHISHNDVEILERGVDPRKVIHQGQGFLPVALGQHIIAPWWMIKNAVEEVIEEAERRKRAENRQRLEIHKKSQKPWSTGKRQKGPGRYSHR